MGGETLAHTALTWFAGTGASICAVPMSSSPHWSLPPPAKFYDLMNTLRILSHHSAVNREKQG